MASHASLVFTLFLCACVYTVVECDSTCTNMLECTMYNIQQVGSKVDGIQTNMAAIVNQLSQIQGALNTTEHRLKAVEEENIKLREDLDKGIEKQNTSFVSFRASPSKTRTYSGYRPTLIFDTVRVNLGQHYDAATSSFICPYDAYYLFVVTVQNWGGKMIRASLNIDGSNRHRIRNEDKDTEFQVTIVVVDLCLTGQRVRVTTIGEHWTDGVKSEEDYQLYGELESSSFSGTVLRAV